MLNSGATDDRGTFVSLFRSQGEDGPFEEYHRNFNGSLGAERLDLRFFEEAVRRLGDRSLSHEAPSELVAHASVIAFLIERTRVDCDTLLRLPEEFRAQLYDYPDAVCSLVSDEDLSWEQLCQLASEERLQLYAKSSEMRSFLRIAEMDWKTFFELPLRSELYEHTDEIFWLLRDGGCSFKNILAMPPFLREGLYAYAASVLKPRQGGGVLGHEDRIQEGLGHVCVLREMFRLLEAHGMNPTAYMIDHPEISLLVFEREECARASDYQGQRHQWELGIRKKFDRFFKLSRISPAVFWSRPEAFRLALCRHVPAVLIFLARFGFELDYLWRPPRLFSPDDMIVFLSKTKIPLESFLTLSPDLCDRLYRCRAEAVSLLQDKKHAWFLCKEILGKVLFSCYAPLEPCGLFNQIKILITRRLCDAGILPPDYVLEADTMASFTRLLQTVLEMKKNAVLFQQARLPSGLFEACRPPVGLGDLPDILHVKILDWTGHGQHDGHAFLASDIYQQEKEHRARRMWRHDRCESSRLGP